MPDSKPEAAAVADEPVSAVNSAPVVTATTITFKAPDHVSAVYFSTGRILGVEDGTLTAPADLIGQEIADLSRLGFVAG